MLKVDRLSIAGLPPLSFEVAASQCLAVEGPSGSGKTRILRAIADLDPAAGQVYLDGAERAEMPAPAWRRRVRYSPAEPAWWETNARAHVAADEMPRFERLASSLGLERAVLDRPIAQCSMGERLRLGLARACCGEPQVLLLDEPTGGLDGAAALLVEELVRFLVLAGRSIVLVTHDPGQAARLAHQRLQLAMPGTPLAAKSVTVAADDRLATLAQRWRAQK